MRAGQYGIENDMIFSQLLQPFNTDWLFRLHRHQCYALGMLCADGIDLRSLVGGTFAQQW